MTDEYFFGILWPLRLILGPRGGLDPHVENLSLSVCMYTNAGSRWEHQYSELFRACYVFPWARSLLSLSFHFPPESIVSLIHLGILRGAMQGHVEVEEKNGKKGGEETRGMEVEVEVWEELHWCGRPLMIISEDLFCVSSLLPDTWWKMYWWISGAVIR